MFYNRVILIGRIATDPVRRYTPAGTAVTNFRLAVGRPSPAPDGKDTDFFTIVAWRELAERIANAEKGRLVCVEGRLRERSWIGRDGTRKRTVEVFADAFRFLDKAPQPATPSEEYVPEEEIEIDDNLHIIEEEGLEDIP
ncbi:single-stranded DNA-binding protein [bacterium]|nr:single-stranded DNA-binding protein [bacterium]